MRLAMSDRSEVEALRAFYLGARIAVRAFACPNVDRCIQAAAPRKLTHGAEAHVGSRYGDRERLVVVSLDAGGESKDLETSRTRFETIGDSPNLHMKGTIQMLGALFNEDDPLPFFAMINATKCSAVGSRDKVPDQLYWKCRRHALEELRILMPDLVWTQGTMAREVLPSPVSLPADDLARMVGDLPEREPPVASWLRDLAGQYLRVCTQPEGQTFLAVLTPHPAARMGQWQMFLPSMKPLVWLVRRWLELGGRE